MTWIARWVTMLQRGWQQRIGKTSGYDPREPYALFPSPQHAICARVPVRLDYEARQKAEFEEENIEVTMITPPPWIIGKKRAQRRFFKEALEEEEDETEAKFRKMRTEHFRQFR